MAKIILDAIKGKGVSTSFTLNKGDDVTLSGFDLSQAQLFVNELGQLIIVLLDGTQFMLSNFAQLVADNPDLAFLTSADGQSLSYSDVIAKFLDNDAANIEPALGTQSTFTTSTTDALGSGSGAALGESILLNQGDAGGAQFTLSANNAGVVQTQANENNRDRDEQLLSSTVPPSNNDGSVSGSEDTSFNLNIQAPTDIDTPAEFLTITVNTLPNAAEGVIQLNGINIVEGQILTVDQLQNLVFVPAPDFNGSTEFSYNISDGINVVESTQDITVIGTEDLPEVSGPSSITIDEDDPAVDLDLAIPTDADTPYGDVLTTVIDTPTSSINGTITLDGVPVTDGQTFTTDELARLQFTPNADFNGTIVINYTTTDSDGNSVSNTHTINVNSIEDAPEVVNSVSSQNEDSTDVTLGINTPTDADGDVLQAVIDPLPTEGTLKFADGTPVQAGVQFSASELAGITFTPNADFNGSVTIDYTVTDGKTPPVDGSHTVTVTPENDAPVVNDGNSTVTEDATDIALGITPPTDADGDLLVAKFDTLPTEGTLKFADGTPVPAGVEFDAAELAGITFTPNPNFNGTVEIDYTVSDGVVEVPGKQTVTVDPVDDVPVIADPDSSSTVNEDSTSDVNIPIPTDADGDPLSIVIDTLPGNATLTFADGTPVQAGVPFTEAQLAGMQITPLPNYTGDIVINYSVTDGNSAPIDGKHTVTVNEVNDAPIVNDSSSTQDEDTSDIALTIPTPTDEEGDPLSFSFDNLPTEGTIKLANGTLVQAGVSYDISELAGLTFTPNPDFNGTVTIEYNVSDGSVSSSGTHTVTVNPLEDAPVANDSSSSQDEDSTDVALGIPAPTDVDGDALSVTIAVLPTEGTLKFADGTPVQAGVPMTAAELAGLTFTPNAQFSGTVTIDYSVTDGNTPPVDATHTVTVNNVDDSPVVNDSTSTQDEDTTDIALGIPLPTDEEGDPMTAKFDTLPTEGTLKFADGTPVQAGVSFDSSELAGITFTPNADFNGDVSLDYTVSDGNSESSGNHTVTVNPVEDAPEVVNSVSSQDEDSSDVTLGIPVPTDADGDTLTVTIDNLPTDGTLKFANGAIVTPGVPFNASELAGLTFTPNEDFNGTIEIEYTVSDGKSPDVTGKHTVTVSPVEDAPEVIDSSSSQDEDTVDIPLGIPAPTDADGDLLVVTIDPLPTEGTLKFADGTPVQAGVAFTAADLAGLTFTPNPNFNGTIDINYSVTDGNSAPVDGKHSLTVNPVNDAPTVVNSSSTQDEDTTNVPLGIPLPTDADGDTLMVTINALPTEGTLRYANGALVQPGVPMSAADLAGLTFTPNPDFNGVVQINYVVSDGTDDVLGSHVITVNDTPDVPEVILRYDTLNLDTGIIADLNNGTVDRQDGQVDNVDHYRGIVATGNDDIVYADTDADNYIDLQQGNDLAVAGAGADTIKGGTIGVDTVSYQNSNAGVNIDLTTNTAFGGHAEGDSLHDIEGLIGSSHNDVLVGNSADNYLDGGAGSDKLYGGDGHDTIVFDANDSIIAGNSGYDTLKITDAYTSDNNVIDLSNVSGTGPTVSSFEEIDMDNNASNETIQIKVYELLPQSDTGYIKITGDTVAEGAAEDDNVQLTDKSTDAIMDAYQGTTSIDNVTYTVLDFGSEGKMYIESGVDILDASGNQVI